MKFKSLFLLFAAVFSAVAIGFLSACSKTDKMDAHDDGVDYYTCTMHPSVKSHDPKAKCQSVRWTSWR